MASPEYTPVHARSSPAAARADREPRGGAHHPRDTPRRDGRHRPDPAGGAPGPLFPPGRPPLLARLGTLDRAPPRSPRAGRGRLPPPRDAARSGPGSDPLGRARGDDPPPRRGDPGLGRLPGPRLPRRPPQWVARSPLGRRCPPRVRGASAEGGEPAPHHPPRSVGGPPDAPARAQP